MNYLALFFRERKNTILVPVVEAEVNRLLKCFTDCTDPLPFIEFASVVEHDIWVNAARLQMVRFLVEPDSPPFDPETIGPSKQFPKNEGEEPKFGDLLWNVTFWLAGRSEPVDVSDISGGDWVEIYTSLVGEEFIVVTDEDDEELALRVSEIDMISGVEFDRYSEAQLRAVEKAIKA